MTTDTKKELTITRIFNAPCEIVFKAWTDVKQLAQWWGPNGFTNPVCEIDLRPGGKILIHMKDSNETVYPMGGVFHEITEPKRLVFTSSALDESGNSIFDVLNTITFEKLENKTRLTMNAKVITQREDADQYISGMNEGWNQSLDRLSNLIS